MTRRSSNPARLLVAFTCLAVVIAACTSAGASAPPGSPGGSLLPPVSAVPSTSPSASPAPVTPASKACPTVPPPPLAAGETRTVTIETAEGQIVLKIDGDLAPNAAGNFVALAECGYYDGVVFHRLVPNFVIQGGDPTGTGTGGPGYGIKDQEVKGEYKRGTLAMARTPAPDSQGSQFFIVLTDEAGPTLETYRTYAIFGEVVSGMETADAIAAMPNKGEAEGNAAVNPVAMDNLTVTNP